MVGVRLERRLDGRLHARRVGDVAGQDLAVLAAGQAHEEAIAAEGERLVADFLVEADRVLDAGCLEPFTGAEACLVFGLADVGQDAQVPEDVGARVHRHDRDARRDGLLDGRPKGVGVRDRDDQSGRVLGDGGVDERGHPGMSLSALGAL